MLVSQNILRTYLMNAPYRNSSENLPLISESVIYFLALTFSIFINQTACIQIIV